MLTPAQKATDARQQRKEGGSFRGCQQSNVEKWTVCLEVYRKSLRSSYAVPAASIKFCHLTFRVLLWKILEIPVSLAISAALKPSSSACGLLTIRARIQRLYTSLLILVSAGGTLDLEQEIRASVFSFPMLLDMESVGKKLHALMRNDL